MKKHILILLMLAFVSFGASAQFGSGVKLPLSVGDTIKNASTVSKVISATGGYSGTNIQVVLSSIDGTPGGTVKLWGSTDNGVTYDQILSSAGDTLAISASKLHYTFKVAGPLPPKLKVVAVGTGTQNTLVSVWYKLSKYLTQ